jgi:hypothetical protein
MCFFSAIQVIVSYHVDQTLTCFTEAFSLPFKSNGTAIVIVPSNYSRPYYPHIIIVRLLKLERNNNIILLTKAV